MITYSPLDHDTCGAAFRFVSECEDEDPVGYGVDLFPAFPKTRAGVHRAPSSPDIDWDERLTGRYRDYEDALIARLDGDLTDDDDDLTGYEERYDEDVEGAVSVARFAPAPDGKDNVPVQLALADDPTPVHPAEVLPSCVGCGRAKVAARGRLGRITRTVR